MTEWEIARAFAMAIMLARERCDTLERERNDALLEGANAAEVLQGRAEQAEAEVARLRARVRVEVGDVERVTWANVVAWVVAAGWHKSIRSVGWRYSPSKDAFEGFVASGGAHDIARAVNLIAGIVKRPGLDILDEMAAMEVEP